MSTVIVPDYLHDEINAKLDAAIAEFPDAECDRQIFYDYLLSYVHKHGVLPLFHLQKKSP